MRLRRRFNSDFVEVGEPSVPSDDAEKQDAFQRFFRRCAKTRAGRKRTKRPSPPLPSGTRLAIHTPGTLRRPRRFQRCGTGVPQRPARANRATNTRARRRRDARATTAGKPESRNPTLNTYPVRREREQRDPSLEASKLVGYADSRRTVLPSKSEKWGLTSERAPVTGRLPTDSIASALAERRCDCRFAFRQPPGSPRLRCSNLPCVPAPGCYSAATVSLPGG